MAPTNPSSAGEKPRKGAKRPSSTKLASGRPPTATKPTAALSSRQTRKLINTHHQLNKRLAQAEREGDEQTIALCKKSIAKQGGLKTYQVASIQGQAKDRGGDASIVLMQWLKPHLAAASTERKDGQRLRLLEVGALSTSNACSRADVFDVQRIDLNSQSEGILQQDFMERPLPEKTSERFDVISLSLVLNYVPDAEGRGEMLKRTCLFLDTAADGEETGVFPALFLVLPAPCVTNSRYMTEERLTRIMQNLGYVLHETKTTAKLVYYLWILRQTGEKQRQDFPKQEINPGPARNNFSIVLR